MNAISRGGLAILFCTTALSLGMSAHADDTVQTKLLERLNALEAELQQLKAQLAETSQKADQTEKRAARAEKQARNATASSDIVRPNSWHLAGYADVGVEITDGEDPDTFTSGKFNPAFHFQYKDLVLFESEFEVSTNLDGETDMALEYSQLDFLLHDNAVLVAGKFLSPVGQFQERLHPSWINRSFNAPAGFGHGGIQPISDVGLMLRGGIPVGERMFTYSVAVGNGPRAGHDGVEVEGFGRDDNSNKAISGRLAFFPLDDLEIGGSFLTAKVAPEADDTDEGHEDIAVRRAKKQAELALGEVQQSRYKLWGFDAAYTGGNWDIRTEYLKARLNGFGDGDADHGEPAPLSWKAWYAQVAYRLSDISTSPFIQRLEPVARYGEFRASGDHELEDETNEKRFNLGLNYWFTPSVVVKGGVEFRNYMASERADDTRLQLQLAYGF
jgi:hypothetical protein